MIGGIGAMTPRGPVRGAGARRAAGAFHIEGTSEPAPSGAASEVAGASLYDLLALQDEQSGEVQDREARGRGQDLLGALGDLQRDLLGTGDCGEQLGRLAALAAEVPRAADRRLRDLVGAIALRARIEVARRQATVQPYSRPR